MKLKYALKLMFHMFCIITTGQVFFVSVILLINEPDAVFTMREMLQMPFVALAGVLPILIFVRSEKATRTELIVRNVLHFILTAGIVLGLLIYFGWMYASNAVIIIGFFLAIYIPAYIVQEIRDRKLAKQLNERINAFHNTENETHRD
jgi:hypothetical protein